MATLGGSCGCGPDLSLQASRWESRLARGRVPGMKRLLLLLLLLIPFAGCKGGPGDYCRRSEDCASGLACFTRGGEANDAAAEAFAISSPHSIYNYHKFLIEDPIDYGTCLDAVSLVEAARAAKAWNEENEANRAEAARGKAEEEAARAKAEAEAKAAQAKAKAERDAKMRPVWIKAGQGAPPGWTKMEMAALRSGKRGDDAYCYAGFIASQYSASYIVDNRRGDKQVIMVQAADACGLIEWPTPVR